MFDTLNVQTNFSKRWIFCS